MIVFITSVRHPHNCNQYQKVLSLLNGSLRSVCGQEDNDFRVICVCNERPEIAFKDARIEYLVVNFPPPSTLANAQTGLGAVRHDKGAKYAVGLLHAKKLNPEYVMFFDADDFIHRDIAGYCNQRPGENGWYVENGFVYWGGMLYSPLELFYKWCGTCNILNYNLIELPVHLTPSSTFDEIISFTDNWFLTRILGAHPFTVDYFADRGHPLAPLPFPGAVYARETGENHSGIFIGNRPKILTKNLANDFGIKIKVNLAKQIHAFCWQLPRQLYRILRYWESVPIPSYELEKTLQACSPTPSYGEGAGPHPEKRSTP